MNNLAITYKDVGRLKEAIMLHEQTLKIRVSTLGTEHPHTVSSLFGLGCVDLQSLMFLEAEAHLLQAGTSTKSFAPALKDKWRATIIKELVNLYDAWDKSEKCAEWRIKLEKLQKPAE